MHVYSLFFPFSPLFSSFSFLNFRECVGVCVCLGVCVFQILFHPLLRQDKGHCNSLRVWCSLPLQFALRGECVQ